MSNQLTIEGTVYISSKRASELSGYTQDYIGQLARAQKILARRVGGLWYVLEKSLLGHKKISDYFVPIPPSPADTKPLIAAEDASIVTFDGKTYVSASRAAKLTSYHQDYIGQLARSGKILSHQIGTRWYVDIDALKTHKKEKDALLGAVQASSVGVSSFPDPTPFSRPNSQASALGDLHFNYIAESKPAMPLLQKHQSALSSLESYERTEGSDHADSEKHVIPIRVVHAAHVARARTLTIESRLKYPVRIPGKSILSKTFRLLAFILVIILVYNIQPFGSVSMYGWIHKNRSGLSTVVEPHSLRGGTAIRDLIESFFSKRLEFKRQ